MLLNSFVLEKSIVRKPHEDLLSEERNEMIIQLEEASGIFAGIAANLRVMNPVKKAWVVELKYKIKTWVIILKFKIKHLFRQCRQFL